MSQTTYSFDDVIKKIRGKKILVANRGIPARRIVRSIREVFQGVAMVTTTDVDRIAPFTAGAQELLHLGENPRAYLDIDRIISKAKARGVAAIHPGWGFASEDDSFASKCAEAGIVFIGPTSEAMRLLGNKVQVRILAKRLGIPVVPGSEGAVTVEEAKGVAAEIGLPIMLKAEGGGGGRGIYEVCSEDQLDEAFFKASTLAQASFGNPRLFVERLLTSVRHIEIQVIADKYGNAFAFDERDCTVQRNHQKLVEITPSPWPGMTEELRDELKSYALQLVREVGYHSLCTVEFLVEETGRAYLIEVNTRLQVEHGITECRYGIDLVEEQIAVAFGSKLRLSEKLNTPHSYAMQVRINCEDPQHGFAPNAGRITRYLSPGGPGVRVDSCVCSGYEFPAQYDSAASLLIAHGPQWDKVLGTMKRALGEYVIGGVKTTIPFHRQIIAHPQFRAGQYNTKFIECTPELMNYLDKESEAVRLSRLVAEISAHGYNPYVKLGEYRTREGKHMAVFRPSLPRLEPQYYDYPYPRRDRDATLAYLRDSGHVHFSDTTTRDITQSNSGNRFRLAEDRIIGPYLDNCGFFSLENGGGAHFHVAMLANMTYPFSEAREWNEFAPKTLKQILIRSTNVLGYKPQPRNLMQRTGEMICEHYDVIRCFDFLNHIENMRPFAEVALNSRANIWEPAVSLSWAKGFDVPHYLGVVQEIIEMTAQVAGCSKKKAEQLIILGLKDMAGVCPPIFMTELVSAIRTAYPSLIIHAHRHYTDGLFVPAMAAAASAGAHIVDTAIGAAVRWYGQGEVLSTAAYLEELGLKTNLNKEMIRTTGFVLKQIMPYYDRYTAPYFQGVDYDVINHGMPGGATSSSQEGAMKQGYIHLLPYMLKFLAGIRKIVRYHDVTPGSQITWNTAFLAVTGTYKRGGLRGVRKLLAVLDQVVTVPEESLPEEVKVERLKIYEDANDAFRDLLLGKFGRLPLGFPPDWVYESAFGPDYQAAISCRTECSPLNTLPSVDLLREQQSLTEHIDRVPTDEELIMYLNHPGDALNTIKFVSTYGDCNCLPLHVWFEGLRAGEGIMLKDSSGKPHALTMQHISRPDDHGMSLVSYTVDSESFLLQVKVAEAVGKDDSGVEKADVNDPYQVASPSSGDLWVMHVKPGDLVKKGEELFNISIMKQEKSILAPVDGMVARVLKSADFQEDKKMVPVQEGELLVVLVPAPRKCPTCTTPVTREDYKFCPGCGQKV